MKMAIEKAQESIDTVVGVAKGGIGMASNIRKRGSYFVTLGVGSHLLTKSRVEARPLGDIT